MKLNDKQARPAHMCGFRPVAHGMRSCEYDNRVSFDLLGTRILGIPWVSTCVSLLGDSHELDVYDVQAIQRWASAGNRRLVGNCNHRLAVSSVAPIGTSIPADFTVELFRLVVVPGLGLCLVFPLDGCDCCSQRLPGRPLSIRGLSTDGDVGECRVVVFGTLDASPADHSRSGGAICGFDEPTGVDSGGRIQTGSQEMEIQSITNTNCFAATAV